ncbi:MAG: sorbosone dehydrogenase family protein [Candidatus Omnitrophica bacterium]|nr:sorbosone dehydrogenase family protein [Candidatus Omnitrophota bacterium]
MSLCLPVSAADKLDGISLPPGFRIEYFAKNVPGARSLARGSEGTIFVGTRDEGKVYAIPGPDNNTGGASVITIAKGLNMPNGMAFYKKDLYVAQIGEVTRYTDIENRLNNIPDAEVVNDSFPTTRWHGWKYIAFGPDGKLYVPVGAPCNVCEPDNRIYASITRMNPDGSELEIFAEGVRNTVGFDWHPVTGELWFTDNGRDWMGDNLPPDELNRAYEKALHFGFPYCHGQNIPDPSFGGLRPCSEFVPPVQELGPHVAALGMKFYTGRMFPEEYKNQIFIAEHGSWNRSVPIGYRVMLVRLEGDKAVSYEVFAEGWLTKEGAWGRPVDILLLPDGSMLVSDDKNGAIYRITYEKEVR